jgi:peptidoglycan/xylan/chitin deacetylase (PgdA/CDA1 family)
MPAPVILMYHSVDDRRGRSDAWALSVSPDNFASQVEALVSQRTVVPLEDLARCVRAGRIPRGLVAITFDDGYANNATAAKPVLERYGAPATLFYMTAAADTASFWWDRLERLIMEARSLPAVVSIPVVAPTVSVAVEGVDRATALSRVWSRLRDLGPADRERAMAHLADSLALPSLDPAPAPLTIEEVARLDGGVFSIGAHTHSHPSLPSLQPPDIAREIVDSKAICERYLARPVTAFAYPFGDHDDRVVAAVADAGLTVACTTSARAIRPDDHCLTLPRVGVGNWSGEELMRHLASIP